jgi:hypothetical protein
MIVNNAPGQQYIVPFTIWRLDGACSLLDATQIQHRDA